MRYVALVWLLLLTLATAYAVFVSWRIHRDLRAREADQRERREAIMEKMQAMRPPPLSTPEQRAEDYVHRVNGKVQRGG